MIMAVLITISSPSLPRNFLVSHLHYSISSTQRSLILSFKHDLSVKESKYLFFVEDGIIVIIRFIFYNPPFSSYLWTLSV